MLSLIKYVDSLTDYRLISERKKTDCQNPYGIV